MLTRRTLFTVGLAAATAGVASGCQSGASGNQAGAPTTGGWSHTLKAYQGKTITLDHQPETLALDTYSYAAMWPYGVRAAGVWGYGMDDPTSIGDADMSITENLGADGELNLEKLASLRPDLIIGYGNDDGSGWTWWDEAVTTQATQVAPFVPIAFGDLAIPDLIEEYRGLAQSLGGQIDTPEVTAAEQTFTDNLARIKQLTAEKKLKVIALQGSLDGLYVGVNLSVLELLREYGMEFVDAEPTSEGGPWASITWENIGDYPADLIMDFESSDPAAHELELWKRLPAVKANQLTTWNDKRPNNYANYGAWLGELADAYEAARSIV